MSKLLWKRYLFYENVNNMPECIVCGKVDSHRRTLFMKRHFNAKHRFYDDCSEAERTELISNLEKEFYKNVQKGSSGSSSGTTSTSLSRANMQASLIVSQALAAQGRPKSDGAFLIEVFKSVLECEGERGKALIPFIDSIRLSRTTLARYAKDLSTFQKFEEAKLIASSKFYKNCLDKTTDTNDVCQLLVSVKTVGEKPVTSELVLCLISLDDRNKLASICAAETNLVAVKNEGFVVKLQKNNTDVSAYHCILYQQALFTKCATFNYAMAVACQIINKIRDGQQNPLQHSLTDFVKVLEVEYTDLVLHNSVRWLSRGNSLETLFCNRKEVLAFLKQEAGTGTTDLADALENPKFLLDLAFLCDITKYLNELKLELEDSKPSDCDLKSLIDSFKQKLNTLFKDLNDNQLLNFPKMLEITDQYDLSAGYKEYEEALQATLKNCDGMFQTKKEVNVSAKGKRMKKSKNSIENSQKT